MKATDYVQGRRIFALVKGDPGAGKSIAVASWLAQGPMYYFDFDGKIGAVINYFRKTNPSLLDGLEYDRFSSYNEAAQKLAGFIKNGHNYTGGIVWDTLTTSVDSILAQVNDMKGGGSKKVGGIAVNEIEDYNAESAALSRLVQHAKFKLQGNFFMLAHVVTTSKEDLRTGATIESRQLLTAGKKVAAKLPAYFDEIWHCACDAGFDIQTGKNYTKYIVHTQHAGTDFARTSLAEMPDTLDITNQSLYEQLKDKLGGA